MRNAKNDRVNLGVIGARSVGDFQGGIETYCRNLYHLLSARIHTTIFVSRRCAGEIDHASIDIVRVPNIRTKYFETLSASTISVIIAWTREIGVLHVHGLTASFSVPLARALGIRTIVRHLGAEYRRSKWGLLARWILQAAEYLVAAYADVIVCLTAEIAREFAEATGRTHNVVVVGDAVDTSLFSPTNCLRLESERFVLGVGRLVPEKNFHLLIQAFRRATLPDDARLIIAGDFDYPSSYRDEMRRLAEGDKRIVLAGAIYGASLVRLYQTCEVFVHPSEHEGMPLALLEAAAAGAKIIASDTAANRSVSPRCARLVQVNSVEELTEAISTEWARQRGSEEIRQQIEWCRETFSWSRTGMKMEALFEGCSSCPTGLISSAKPEAD